MPGIEAMIRAAERSLGAAGRPNTITRWYSRRNGPAFATAPWCNMAVTYWANRSGNTSSVCFGGDYAYTVWHAERFRRQGQWHVDVAGIRRGDIVFFDWDGSNQIGRIDHIGIVTGVGNGVVYTIEGNTQDGCRRRARYASSIVGYGRPQYEERSAGKGRSAAAGAARQLVTGPGDLAPPGIPVLYRGSAGILVKQLQRCLNTVQRSALEVDGIYGPLTTAAVRSFQRRSRSLAVDGRYGPKTSGKLTQARSKVG